MLAGEHLWPSAQLLLFFMSVAAIVPLAILLSKATESVAERTGDAAGGLLNATLGNLTEFVIAITALASGDHTLVKASIAGAIVTNTLFMLGGCFLIGGLKTHTQEFNRSNARFQGALLFLAVIALMTPTLVGGEKADPAMLDRLSLGLAAILLLMYGLGMLFSLATHKGVFAGEEHDLAPAAWPLAPSLVVLAVATVFVALVSEVFVGAVEEAANALGLSKAFVGFIVVALVGASAEMATAFAAARKNRLDLSISIALGSAAQIALFVAPSLVIISYFVGPRPMNLHFWPGVVAMILLSTVTVVFLTNAGRSAWFFGAMILAIYAIFAWALFLLPV